MQLSELNLDWTTHSCLERGTAKIGEWTVSVVVSESSYCEPRQNNLPIDEYTEVEVAIMKAIPGKKRPIYWTMQGTPVEKYFSKYDEIAAYVSIEALSEIMQYLRLFADWERESEMDWTGHRKACEWGY